MAEQDKAAPKPGDGAAQKGGGQSKEQTSAVPQAEKEFRPIENGRNSDEHGQLVVSRLAEVRFSNAVEDTYSNTYRRFE